MRKGNQFLWEGWDSLMNKSGLLCWITWFHIKSECFHIQCDSLQVREKSIKQNQRTESILKMHTQTLQVLILYGITTWRRLENLMATGRRGLFNFFFFFFWRKILCPQVYQWQSFIFLAHVTCSFEETASTPGSSELKIPNADAFPLTERPVRPQVVLVSNRKVIRDCGFPKQLLFCLKFIVSFLLYIILSNSSKYCITSMELCFFFF